MDEITYLNYGLDQVDQLEFLANAANNVVNYVSKLPWSKKKKNLFLQAYQDIMTRGVIGADNSSGTWNVQYNGDAIDLDSMSEKERQMYSEAAYYILQQMSPLVKPKDTSAKKNSDLPLFDNNYFISHFNDYIARLNYGGRNFDVSEWDSLDDANKYGIRGTLNRAARMATLLQGYGNTLQEGQHNFEDSPFTDLNDFKSRLNEAVAALQNGTWDSEDIRTLNRIGINPRTYFNTGADDVIDFNGQQITRLEAMNLNLLDLLPVEQSPTETVAETAILAPQYYFSRSAPTMVGRNKELIKSKYKDLNSLKTALAQYGTRVFNTLDPDSQSEIVGIYKNFAKDEINDDLYHILKLSNRYKTANKTHFKYIEGIDNFVWDSSTQQVIQISTSKPSATESAWSKVTTSEQREAQLMNTPRGNGYQLTAADYREIGAIGAEILLLIDIEPISSTVLGIAATGARAWNYDWSNHFWESLGKTALDGGLAAVSALPLIGEALSIAKIGKGLVTMSKVLSPIIAASSMPDAINAWNKIQFNELVRGNYDSLKQLTPNDYRALYNVFQGVVAGKAYRDTLTRRKIMLTRGVLTSNNWYERIGLTETTPVTSVRTPTVRVKTPTGEVEVKLTPDEKIQLETALKQAGKDAAKRDVALRTAVKGKSELTGVAESDISAISSPTWRSSRFSPISDTKGMFGETTVPASRGEDTFEQWLQNGRSWPFRTWSDDKIRRWDKNFQRQGYYNVFTPTTSTTPISSSTSVPPKHMAAALGRLTRLEMGHYSGSKFVPKSGTYTIKDRTFSVTSNPDGTFTLKNGDSSSKFNSTDLKREIFRIIKDAGISSFDRTTGKFASGHTPEQVLKILKEIRKLNWLKQGGTITDLRTYISQTLKQ